MYMYACYLKWSKSIVSSMCVLHCHKSKHWVFLSIYTCKCGCQLAIIHGTVLALAHLFRIVWIVCQEVWAPLVMQFVGRSGHPVWHWLTNQRACCMLNQVHSVWGVKMKGPCSRSRMAQGRTLVFLPPKTHIILVKCWWSMISTRQKALYSSRQCIPALPLSGRW